MTTPQEYLERLATAVGGKVTENGIAAELEHDETLAGMQSLRKRIVQMQTDIRFIKKQINQEMKEIRQGYSQQAANVQPGFLSIMAGKGHARKDVADKKRQLARERDAVLHPYNVVKLGIDDLLTQLDSQKINLGGLIEEEKAKQPQKTRETRSQEPASGTSFCPQCGNSVDASDKFCRSCGATL